MGVHDKRGEEMSDLIRREDAIKAIAEVLSLNRFSSFKDIKNFDKFAERMLRNVPSADRPQGEWKSVKASIYPYGCDVECSICGHRMGSSFGYKYCPMCGADMKGADDE